jgi:hypothetical protein
MSAQWNLLAFLPNLYLKAPAAFSVGDVQICSGESSELSNLASSSANETALAMLGVFVTTFGTKYRPACLLFRKGPLPTAAALRDFRNLCAVAAVAGGTTSRLSGGQWNVVHSDHFLFGHHVPGSNGWITTLDGHVRGMNDEVDKFGGHSLASIDDPTSFGVLHDEPLYRMLCWAWQTLHQKGKAKRKLGRVFRSLEVAFQAARYPSDGLTTPNDVGTRIGLWVSAFEVLLNPKKSVDKVAIENALASCDWLEPKLQAKRYSVRQNKKVVRVSLPVKLYDRLYSARNTFMHGNSIVGRPLSWTRGTKRLPLISCAPCLFAATLRLPLVSFGAPFDENDEWWSGLRQIGRALLAEADG